MPDGAKPYPNLDSEQYEALTQQFRDAAEHALQGSHRNLLAAYSNEPDEDVELTKTNVYRLLSNLCQNVQDMDTLFTMMDKDGSGEVNLHEFLHAVDEAIGQESAHLDTGEFPTKSGYAGTRWRNSGNILWCILGLMTVIVVAVCYFLLKELSFILKPVGMAYFLCLLLQPAVDLLEQRPLAIGPYLMCHHNPDWKIVADARQVCNCMTSGGKKNDWCNASSESRLAYMKGNVHGPITSRLQAIKDFVQLGKFPHSLAVIIVSTGFFAILLMLAQVTIGEFKALYNDKNFEKSLTSKIVGIHLQLCDFGYNVSEIAALADYGWIDVDNEPTLIELEELILKFSPVTSFMTDASFAIMMLVLMMFARTKDAAQSLKQPHMMSVGEQIESQVGTYIKLKFAVSLMTGSITWFILTVFSIPMATLLGILSCVLNFIPNVGSLIAMALPIPIILCQVCEAPIEGPEGFETNPASPANCLNPPSHWFAILLPCISNTMIGTFVEPIVFGKRLNLTMSSIIVALLFWGYVWGIPGMILSVPLLSLMKTLLQEADHPLAARAVEWIREDPTVDELRENLKHKRINTLSRNFANLAGPGSGKFEPVSDGSVEVMAV